jgi:hypothetical protein
MGCDLIISGGIDVERECVGVVVGEIGERARAVVYA